MCPKFRRAGARATALLLSASAPLAQANSQLERCLAAHRFSGSVITRRSEEYSDALLQGVKNGRYLTVLPSLLLYCSNTHDVVAAVRCASTHGSKVCVRSGGHDFEGRSTCWGVVVDVSQMKNITVLDQDAQHEYKLQGHTFVARVDAGFTLGDLSYELAKHNRAFPTGSCTSVGMTGYLLGGGYGVMSRLAGLGSDNVLAATVVLHNGTVIEATDNNEHARLLWALRGSGQASFGVVVSFVLRTYELSQFDGATFTVNWPWEDTLLVLETYDKWKQEPQIFAKFIMGRANEGETPSSRIQGFYFGGNAEEALSVLEDTAFALLDNVTITAQNATYIDMLGGFDALVKPYHADKADNFKCKSAFVSEFLTSQQQLTLIRYFSMPLMPNDEGAFPHCYIEISPFDGLMQQASVKSSWAHRSARLLLHNKCTWLSPDFDEMGGDLQLWLDGLHSSLSMEAYGAYQNYMDNENPFWRQAYFGDETNFVQLQSVKALYDPSDYFRVPQGIPLPPRN